MKVYRSVPMDLHPLGSGKLIDGLHANTLPSGLVLAEMCHQYVTVIPNGSTWLSPYFSVRPNGADHRWVQVPPR
jgi:hypothetical protein